MTKYILFCSQCANFQTRSILIPYNLFIKCETRAKDLEFLRQKSEHNILMIRNNKPYNVDNLLYRHIIWDDRIGKVEQNDINRIISELTMYAEGMNKNCYIHLYDKEWYDKSICHVTSKGFNHLNNYCNFRNKTQYKNKNIDIVEGFLVLETNNGKLEYLEIDTIEELYEQYY